MDTLEQNLLDNPVIPRPRRAGDDTATSELSLRTERPERGTVVLTLRGEVDRATAPRLAEVLRSRLRSQLSRVVVDLSEVSFLDAAGISALIQADLRAQCTDTTLEIVSGGKYSPDKFASRGRES